MYVYLHMTAMDNGINFDIASLLLITLQTGDHEQETPSEFVKTTENFGSLFSLPLKVAHYIIHTHTFYQ